MACGWSVALGLWTAVSSSLAAPGLSVPRAPSRLHVLVRVDVDRTVRDIAMTEVIDQIRDVWKPYLDVDFAEAADLVDAVYDDEVRLFVIGPSRAANAANPPALGWIMFPEPRRPNNVITVSAGAARNLMEHSQWRGWHLLDSPRSIQKRFLNRAIGRSAAHELGHYLLRMPSHRLFGLMRAQMSPSDIMEDGLGLFGLDAADVASLEPHTWLAQAGSSNLKEKT